MNKLNGNLKHHWLLILILLLVMQGCVALNKLDELVGGEESEIIQIRHQVTALFQDGKYGEAIPLAEKELKMVEALLGVNHPNTATSLNNLGGLYLKLGDFDKAKTFYQRAIDITGNDEEQDDPIFPTLLNNLGELYEAKGDYGEAKKVYEQAFEIRKKNFGPDHPEVAYSLGSLALLLEHQGQFEEAEGYYKRSLVILKKSFGENHQAVASSLNNLGGLYLKSGDFQKAETTYQNSLKQLEKLFGPDHPNVALGLNNLAALYFKTGKYTEAASLYNRSLKITETSLGAKHVKLATSLNNLAALYFKTGSYAKAEPLYKRSLKIAQDSLGAGHPKVASTLNNLAGLYKEMADYPQAEAMYKQSLEISRSALGAENPKVAQALFNLGGYFETIGDFNQGKKFYQDALQIQEKAFAGDHPDIANSLNRLGGLSLKAGNIAEADKLFQRAYKIRKAVFGNDHPDVAESIYHLAQVHDKNGDYKTAESFYIQSLDIFENSLGPEHSQISPILSQLASLDVVQEKFAPALSYYKKGLAIEEKQIQTIFSIATDRQKLKFIQSIREDYEACLSFIHQKLSGNAKAVQFGLELVLHRKGIVYDSQSRVRLALKERLSDEGKVIWEQLSSVRNRLAYLSLNKPDDMNPEVYRDLLVSLQENINDLEINLSKESALVARERNQRKATMQDVLKGLPKGSALIELVKIRDRNFTEGKWGESRYLAFVLRFDGVLTLVDLNSADHLESLAERFLSNVQTIIYYQEDSLNNELSKTLKPLYKDLWKPLQNSLGGLKKVLISPDGLLNLIPFAALETPQGNPLLETFEIAYLTSGRELIDTAQKSEPQSDLLLVANPLFGSNDENPNVQAKPNQYRDSIGQFGPLPGTAREAVIIPQLIPASSKKALILTENQAMEGRVKNAKSPRILHLATHGFFLKDSEISANQNFKELSQTGNFLNPLIRSGLVLAGANRTSNISNEDDGILTALEISGMDLFGTELVVLSACQTGVGDIHVGEGVFGLRRSFMLAGAQNLVMSLWPVHDATTLRQMKTFYQNLNNFSSAEALRQAQLQTIRDLKAEYGSAPAWLWAPFILQGPHSLGQ
jgi:tetratricopeptide (TPR) repeat protein/CHAT domain-containing protein